MVFNKFPQRAYLKRLISFTPPVRRRHVMKSNERTSCDNVDCPSCSLSELCSTIKNTLVAPTPKIHEARIHAPLWTKTFFESMLDTIARAKIFVLNSLRAGLSPEEIIFDVRDFFPTIFATSVSVFSFSFGGGTKHVAIINCSEPSEPEILSH